MQRYERLYGRRAYAPAEERKRIQRALQDARKKSVPVGTRRRAQSRFFRDGSRREAPPAEQQPARQESLF
jgi:hypothetical protein